ncbi:MAG: hypothetical protein ABIP48_22435 [Planctomycetota bacterium]
METTVRVVFNSGDYSDYSGHFADTNCENEEKPVLKLSQGPTNIAVGGLARRVPASRPDSECARLAPAEHALEED